MSIYADFIAANGRPSSLCYDSREAAPGSLYFALPGLHLDGHDFIDDAIKRGATHIVHEDELESYVPGVSYLKVASSRFAMSPIADEFYGSPSKKLTVIGVTGTEGKSTTVYLIFQLLRLCGKKAGFISTVQFSEDGTEQWNTEHQTTPEAPVIHRRLARMVDNGCEFAVLESSSHGLSPRTNRLGDVAFDAAVMTNVTHEHLEFHGTWEQYRDDKANLFRVLGAVKKAFVKECFGVVNACDPSAAYFAAATTYPTLSFSVPGAFPPAEADAAGTETAPPALAANLSVRELYAEAGGSRYTVTARPSGADTSTGEASFIGGGGGEAASGESFQITDRLPGAFNAGNVLAAMLVVSRLLGTAYAGLCPLIPKLQPVRGRMTAVDRGQDFEVLVDYAHTPSSFRTIYPPLRERAGRNGARIISVFGSPGERDTQKRALQGEVADLYSDIVILTDEDPRGEEPVSILEEIAAGIKNKEREKNLFLIPDRPAALRKAFALARTGDIVLLLGKGHENSIIYAGGPVPYDEIAEAEKALNLKSESR
jgi:UDP-N-acetylmuramoyl-L-alanyl-D-glutamate--2,6-diaminopimelate ligase